MTRILCAALAALVLGGCGFHLRGAMTLPPDIGEIRVVAKDRYSPLAESLALALERQGVQARAEGPVEGVSTLDIRFEKWGDTPIAIDVRGRAQEYSLRYATIFELKRADGTVVVPQQSVELSRDYISVPTRSEGTESEREVLMREMQREMVNSILRRIDAVVKAPEPAESDTTQAH